MMTRAEHLEKYLLRHLNLAPELAREVQNILAIADDRTFLTTAQFSRRIGRAANTLITWQNRGQHDIPKPAYVTGTGPIWDAEDVESWYSAHGDLVRKDEG